MAIVSPASRPANTLMGVPSHHCGCPAEIIANSDPSISPQLLHNLGIEQDGPPTRALPSSHHVGIAPGPRARDLSGQPHACDLLVRRGRALLRET